MRRTPVKSLRCRNSGEQRGDTSAREKPRDGSHRPSTERSEKLARWFGKSFADAAFVEDPVTTLFGWCMTLAAVGCARAWGDRENRLTRYISARGFALYQFHYLVLTVCTWGVTSWLNLPAGWNYLLCLGLTLAICLGLYELVSRVPVLGDLFALRRKGKGGR